MNLQCLLVQPRNFEDLSLCREAAHRSHSSTAADMAIGRIVHWIGVVFALVAAILLLITCIGAPAVNDIGLLKVTLNNASDIRRSSVVFGPFGFCVLDVAPAQTDQDYCSGASVGYIPAQEMRLLDPATTWKTWKGHDLDLMTVAYILFPLACAIAFLAAGFAFCGAVGSLIASVLCATAFLCTLAVMVVAFVSFGYLKSHVQSNGGLSAHYGIGMWTCVAAFVLLFLAMLLLFLSCCSGLRRKHRNKDNHKEKDPRHREDSERSLNHPHSNDNHHYGRDAALGGAGVGGYEAEKHHRGHGTNGRSPEHDHHYGRDAALGGAGVGAYEAEKHHRGHGTNGRSPEHDHHYGRDAALGGAGVGGYEAEKHHRGHGTTGKSPEHDHHYGRDAALGGAGVGAYEAEKHHRNRPETARDRAAQGVVPHGGGHTPAGAATVSSSSPGRQNRMKNTMRGDDYDTVLADQDRRNLGHADDDSHHYGRDAAIGGGALGAAGLGAHEFERSRASPTAIGAAAPAPREHKLRETMRDNSNRGYDEAMAPGVNQRHLAQSKDVGAPAHHLATHQGRSPPSYLMDPAVLTHNVSGDQGERVAQQSGSQPTSVTHHHPSITTTNSTYADDTGVYNTGLHTTYDPKTGNTRSYGPGSAI